MESIWKSVRDLINTKISKASYETWLMNTSAEIIDNTVFFKAPNTFAREWIYLRPWKGKFDQCPNCYHTIEYVDGVAFCVTCNDIVVNEDEIENDITLPF